MSVWIKYLQVSEDFLSMTFNYCLIERGQQYQTDWGNILRPELWSVLMRFSINEISMELYHLLTWTFLPFCSLFIQSIYLVCISDVFFNNWINWILLFIISHEISFANSYVTYSLLTIIKCKIFFLFPLFSGNCSHFTISEYDATCEGGGDTYHLNRIIINITTSVIILH